MSYGVQLINQYGEDTLASDGLLFEHSSGNMVDDKPPHLYNNKNYDNHNTVLIQGSTSPVNNAFLYKSTTSYFQTVTNNTDGGSVSQTRDNSWVQTHTNTVTRINHAFESGLSYQQGQFVPYAHSNTDDDDYHYEVFFKIPSTGLHNWAQHYNPWNYAYDANCKGLHFYALQSSKGIGNYIQYLVAWNKKPSVNGETYGMQVKDSSGSTYFDSRYNAKAIRVKDYVEISASDFTDCLNNGTTYNYTLRQSVSNAYVGGGPQMNVRNRNQTGGRYFWRPTFKMTSATNLQMYRTEYKNSNNTTTNNPVEFTVADDTVLTILDV